MRWYVLAPQVLSARKIPVADSYRNAFDFVFVLRSFVRAFVGSRVVSFVSLFLRSFVLSLFRSCLHWFVFFVPGCGFGAFALCDVRRCYLLVTFLRVHPAETRLTVYRRPYMMYSEKFCKSLCPPVFEFYFLKVSRLGVANQESYT